MYHVVSHVVYRSCTVFSYYKLAACIIMDHVCCAYVYTFHSSCTFVMHLINHMSPVGCVYLYNILACCISIDRVLIYLPALLVLELSLTWPAVTP